jgi:ribose/xylose/arabinose/galactoside ABC-type transport system permease subunit
VTSLLAARLKSDGESSSIFRSRLAAVASRYISYVALLVLVIVFGLLQPELFLTARNFNVILQNSAVQSTVAIGLTFVIISGSIDLSVGSVMALSGAIAAMSSSVLGGFAFFVAPLIGALLGAVNGAIFVRGKIPSFVVTLGMLSVARGMTVIITNGSPVPIPFDSFIYEFGTPPNPILIVAALAVLMSFVLFFMKFGQYTFAVGGDEEKARVLGLPVDRIKFLIFVLSGALAGLGGGVLTAQLGSGSPTMATGFELTAISAVVIGGTSLTGGSGSIVGTIVGGLVMATLANGMVILGVSTNVQTVLTGVVLVAAVLISIQRSKLRVMK